MNTIISHQPTYTSPQFRGQATHEIVKIGNASKLLRHETAFFREYETMKKGAAYLQHTFPEVPNLQIVVGACSSGEQAVSWNMLMKNKKPHILGFDISQKSVDEAKKLTYQIHQPKDEKSRQEILERGLSAYEDEFLGFDTQKQSLSQTQKELKELFTDTFEETETIKPKKSKLRKFSDKIKCLMSGGINPEFNTKTFKPKHPEELDCTFVQGDIQNLDKIAPKGKAHMLTFTNALYHLLTNDICGGAYREQLLKNEAVPIITNIVKQINKALAPKGLFMLGESENKQMTDMKLVSKVLEKNGFQKAAKPQNGYCNMWIKCKEVE